MTDFDCANASCASPDECLQRDVCLSVPERKQLERDERIKRIIDETRARHGWSK